MVCLAFPYQSAIEKAFTVVPKLIGFEADGRLKACEDNIYNNSKRGPCSFWTTGSPLHYHIPLSKLRESYHEASSNSSSEDSSEPSSESSSESSSLVESLRLHRPSVGLR